ncbi:MAG TPA: tetratricopeptide repeat protein [Polyangia bacterium]
MRAALVVAIAFACGVARGETTTQQEFAAATALEAKGQFAAAADALEKLGHAEPRDSFAPDALFEAAVVAEERLSDPKRARRLYEEVATKDPSSRLSRRAQTRADFLARSLTTGEEPLRVYDDILTGAAARPRAESRARMEALLQKWPDFALADRALFWLGQRLAEEHRWNEAMARFAELERRFPSSEWALRAKKARADILLSRGHPFVARAIYRDLLAHGDAVARSAGAEGLADSVSWIARAIGVIVCIIYLCGFAWLHLRRVVPRARLRRVPLELLYYLPVATVFVAAALTENRAIGLATTGIGVGGAALVWVTSLGYAARLERGPMSAAARIGRIAAVLAAVIALVFLAVQATGLTDIVIETFRSGPERG